MSPSEIYRVGHHAVRIAVARKSAADPTLYLDLRLPSGRRVRISTGTESVREANAVRDAWAEQHLPRLLEHDAITTATQTGSPAPDPSISTLTEWYVNTHLVYLGRKPKTITKVSQVLRELEMFCKARHIGRVSQLSMPTLQAYLQWADQFHPAGHRAAKTKSVNIAIVRSWVNACVDAGFLESSPVRKWIMPQVPRPTPTALTDAQRDALLDAVRLHSPDAYPIVLLIAWTGFRPSDAIDLRWADVRDDRIVRDQIKTGYQVDIPITPPIREALELSGNSGQLPEAHVFTRADGSPWPPRVLLSRVQTAAHEAPLPFHAHLKLLRTTYATWLARRGANPKLHQALLGHRDLQTTLRYYTQVDYNGAYEFMRGQFPES